MPGTYYTVNKSWKKMFLKSSYLVPIPHAGFALHETSSGAKTTFPGLFLWEVVKRAVKMIQFKIFEMQLKWMGGTQAASLDIRN